MLYILYFHFLKIKSNNYIHKLTNWAGYDENFDFNNLLSCCEIKTRLVFTIKHFFKFFKWIHYEYISYEKKIYLKCVDKLKNGAGYYMNFNFNNLSYCDSCELCMCP